MNEENTKHNQLIMEQFTKQAIPFAEMPGHSDGLDLLIEMSGATKSDDVLDVACGPGLVAFAFAPHTHHVTGIDITPTMITHAQVLQKQKGLTNLSWQVGDVLSLPFPDNSFSLVFTRFSFHHLLDPKGVLHEMVRVCQPGGRVMVVDVALPPEKVDAYNRMEKLRDPSHVKALTFSEMAEIIAAAGLKNVTLGQFKLAMEMEKQIKASFPNPGDADKIRALFEADIGVDGMGVGAHKRDGIIHFAYPVLIVVGEKPVK